MHRQFNKLLHRILAISAALLAFACPATNADDGTSTQAGAATISGQGMFTDEATQNQIADKANRIAAHEANMYRDVRHAIALDATDKEKVQATCTITIRDTVSDMVLCTIKSAPSSPSGSPEPVPVPINEVPEKIMAHIARLPAKVLKTLAVPQGKSVEVMVQIKRDGYSKVTAAMSLEVSDGIPALGQSFVSQDEIIPNSCVGLDPLQNSAQE